MLDWLGGTLVVLGGLWGVFSAWKEVREYRDKWIFGGLLPSAVALTIGGLLVWSPWTG